MTLTKAAVGVALLACLVVIGASSADILNPKMLPDKGTYDAPFGKMGQKATTTWSQTTVAAGVNGVPLAGKATTLVGEIVDYSCYLQLGKHGTKHRDCGQKCLKNGQPIGLLTKDGKLFLLMEEEHDPRRDGGTTFRAAAIDAMSYVMEVTGTLSEVEGQRALYVRGYLKK